MTSINWKIPAPPQLVFIVDDLPEVIEDWERTLSGYGVPIMTASSLEGLNRGFDLYKDDISVIVLDGCIPGHMLNTERFILGARASGFTKPIVAASSSPSYRMKMVEAGCSHQAPKAEAAHLAAKLVGKSVN